MYSWCASVWMHTRYGSGSAGTQTLSFSSWDSRCTNQRNLHSVALHIMSDLYSVCLATTQEFVRALCSDISLSDSYSLFALTVTMFLLPNLNCSLPYNSNICLNVQLVFTLVTKRPHDSADACADEVNPVSMFPRRVSACDAWCPAVRRHSGPPTFLHQRLESLGRFGKQSCRKQRPFMPSCVAAQRLINFRLLISCGTIRVSTSPSPACCFECVCVCVCVSFRLIEFRVMHIFMLMQAFVLNTSLIYSSSFSQPLISRKMSAHHYISALHVCVLSSGPH